MRYLFALLAACETAVALAAVARHTDSPATFANAVTIAFLIAVFLGLLADRRFGMGRLMIGAWLVVGALHASTLLWGAPVGWTLSESIDVGGRHAESQTHVASLDYQAGTVPAHLINDTTKFNFYREDDPNRTKLPVAVVARGYVVGHGSLLISSSSPIQVTVGSETMRLSPPIVQWERGISVSGEQMVEIIVVPTPADKATLAVRPQGLVVYAEPTSGPLMTVRRVLGQLSSSFDLVIFVLALLASAVWTRSWLRQLSLQRRLQVAVIGLTVLLSVLPDLLIWLSQHDQLIVLSGGDDWLTYETFARDIRDGSPLMLLGASIGHGQPFYYQVLYPYAAALGHLITGDSVQGIVLLQLLSAAAAIALAFLAMPKGIYPVAALALVLLGTGVGREWSQQGERLLSENLLLILFALLILLISRLRPIPSLRDLALVGLLLGLGAVTRSTVWLAAPFLAVLFCSKAGWQRLPRSLAALLVPMVLVAALVPARNLVVANNPAWLPTNGSVTFAMGNVPPGRKIQTEPWLELSKRYDPSLVAVAEAVVAVPDQVAAKLFAKTIYVLGFPKSMETDNPFLFWPVLSLLLLAPLGALSGRRSPLGLACLILAGTHILSLVIVHPHYYYYRLEMPATLPLAIWDALALSALLQGLPDPSWAGRHARRAIGELIGA